jgi:hypothetical protein
MRAPAFEGVVAAVCGAEAGRRVPAGRSALGPVLTGHSSSAAALTQLGSWSADPSSDGKPPRPDLPSSHPRLPRPAAASGEPRPLGRWAARPSGVRAATLRYTARAIGWAPLVGGAAMLLALGATVTLAGAEPQVLVAIGAATLAAGALAGLHDPAAALLEAVPVTPARRRSDRLALLLPAAAASWCALLAAARLDEGWSAGWPFGPLAALLAAGIAVATWAPRAWAVSAAVALPMAWFLLDRLVGQADGVAGTVASSWALSAWAVHPWTVAGVATAAALLGWRR